MNANNELEACIVTVPEPETLVFAALGMGAGLAFRRFRK